MNNEWPIITADTPLEMIRKIHQDIWDYVILTGEKPNTPYISNCVLCEYAIIKHHKLPLECRIGVHRCDYCPVEWIIGKPTTRCYHNGTLFNKWYPIVHPLYTEECRNIAKQIRDIPFKRKEEQNV